MTRSAALLCLVALLGCMSSITGASIFDLLNLEFGKAASPLQLSLHCDGNGFEFILPDAVVFRMAFNNTGYSGYAVVESTILGNATGQADCIDKRRMSSDRRTSSTISVSYDQCGIVVREDVDAKITVYSAEAHITLLHFPITGAAFRKTFHIPMTCARSLVSQINTTGNVFREITKLGGVGSIFDVSFDATSRMKAGDFGGNLNVNFFVLTINLDKQYRDSYSIIGDKCWATATIDPASSPTYEFVKSRGYNVVGEDFLVINQTSAYEIIYEIADFEFEGIETPTKYFHCEVNVCLNLNKTRCQSGLDADLIVPDSNGFAPNRNTAADWLLSSAAGNVFREITDLVGVGSASDVSFGATSRQEVRGNDNTNFIILTINLDKQYQGFYSIIGNKCWATATIDPASSPTYEFVKSRGLNAVGEDFLVINQTSPYEIIYEIADFRFEGIKTPTKYFHCKVNVCLNSSKARCQPGLDADLIVPDSNGFAPNRNTATGWVLSSAAEERSSIPAHVKVNSLGRPSRIQPYKG